MAQKVFVPPGQAVDWFEIDPSDTVNIADETTFNTKGYTQTSGLYIGDSGSVTVVLVSGNDKVLPLTLEGPREIPYAVKRVNATDTTATIIYGLISAQ